MQEHEHIAGSLLLVKLSMLTESPTCEQDLMRLLARPDITFEMYNNYIWLFLFVRI